MKKILTEELSTCIGGYQGLNKIVHSSTGGSVYTFAEASKKIVIEMNSPSDAYFLEIENESYLLTYDPCHLNCEYYLLPISLKSVSFHVDDTWMNVAGTTCYTLVI